MKEQTKTKKYIELVQLWNKTHNLISKDQANNLKEHIEDSLSVFDEIGEVLVDLGSGGGLPGIPIAIQGPEKQVILVESNSKKAAFLLRINNSSSLSRSIKF